MSIDPKVKKKYCEILGVSINASKREIEKAYRKQAMKWHPDKHGNSEEAKKKFQEIGNAYQKLTNDDSNEILCLYCDKIGNSWRGYDNKQLTQFCSEECYSKYNANRGQDNTNNNNSGGNSHTHTHTHTNTNSNTSPCCSTCGQPAEKHSQSTGKYFCQACYDWIPNCYWCSKKAYEGGCSFTGRTETFCSTSCARSWESSNSGPQNNYSNYSNSYSNYSNQYSGGGNQEDYSNYYPETKYCSRCGGSIPHGADYYNLGSQNICASCAQKSHGRTCHNCKTQGIETRGSSWKSTSEGDFCSSSCYNDYLNKSRDKWTEENQEKWENLKKTCSQCGSPNACHAVKNSTERLCPHCALKRAQKEENSFENDNQKNQPSTAENKTDNTNSLNKGNKPQPAPINSSSKSLMTETQKQALNEIKWELTNQEAELEVDLTEINLSPVKLVEEMENLDVKEDIENYKSDLIKKIRQKREQKLSALKEEAIQTIQEKLKKEGIELSTEYQDFATKINSQTSAQQVAQLRQAILDQIDQQSTKTIAPEPKKSNDWVSKIAWGAVILGILAGTTWLFWKAIGKEKKLK